MNHVICYMIMIICCITEQKLFPSSCVNKEYCVIIVLDKYDLIYLLIATEVFAMKTEVFVLLINNCLHSTHRVSTYI